jgi:hypothetical protein
MPNIPATAVSSSMSNLGSMVAVGGNLLNVPNSNGYWYVVVDLSNDLNVVANEFSTDNSNPPANIAAMLGNPSYFLFFVAQAQITGLLPQGNLAGFLQKAGAGAQLATLEQTIGQIGTGWLSNFSYVLAATLNDQDLPGFEAASFFEPTILNMQFMPIQVGGQTVYAPVQQSTDSPGVLVTPPLAAG